MNIIDAVCADDVAIAAAHKASEDGSLRADYNDLSTITAA